MARPVAAHMIARKDWGPLQIVSAWASEQGMALGQIATQEKSNEITAIPELLEQIDLKNSIVTIDAMGFQKQIVAQIDKRQGTYVVAVKANQLNLFETVEELVFDVLEGVREDLYCRSLQTTDQSHGRIDERSYAIIKLKKDSPIKKAWPSVKAIGYAVRVSTDANQQETFQTRYFILWSLADSICVCRCRARPLVDRVDALDVGRNLSRGRPADQ
ncbi:MAG: ISAs1 family transposase [Pirellulaceae bacterium]|nr:ISAs1 family transposase [Pirellulaceae bacterium]